MFLIEPRLNLWPFSSYLNTVLDVFWWNSNTSVWCQINVLRGMEAFWNSPQQLLRWKWNKYFVKSQEVCSLMAKYDHLSPLPPEAVVSIVLLSNYPLKNSSQRMKIDFTLFLLTTYFFPLQFILLFDRSKFFYFTLNVANWFCLITIQHCDTIWYYFGLGQKC